MLVVGFLHELIDINFFGVDQAQKVLALTLFFVVISNHIFAETGLLPFGFIDRVEDFVIRALNDL